MAPWNEQGEWRDRVERALEELREASIVFGAERRSSQAPKAEPSAISESAAIPGLRRA
jgi:hypothetical protein